MIFRAAVSKPTQGSPNAAPAWRTTSRAKKKHRRKFLTQQPPSLKESPSKNRGGPGGSPPGGGLGAEPPAYGGKLFHQNFNSLHKLVPFGVFESHENLAKRSPAYRMATLSFVHLSPHFFEKLCSTQESRGDWARLGPDPNLVQIWSKIWPAPDPNLVRRLTQIWPAG